MIFFYLNKIWISFFSREQSLLNLLHWWNEITYNMLNSKYMHNSESKVGERKYKSLIQVSQLWKLEAFIESTLTLLCTSNVCWTTNRSLKAKVGIQTLEAY